MRKLTFTALLFLVGFTTEASAGIIFDLNLSAASGGANADVLGVAAMKTIAGTVVGYKDNDGSGGISTGDTFRGYSVVRVDSFNDENSSPIAVPGYGTTQGITITTVYDGVQIGPNAFLITAVKQLNVYYDFGAGFTAAIFTNLATFKDGSLVESSTTGSGSGTNLSPTNPNGAVNLVAALSDLLHLSVPNEYFEVDSDTGIGLDTNSLQLLLGFFDANAQTVPPANFVGGLNGGTTIRQPPGSLATAASNKVIAAGGGFADIFAAFGLTGTQTLAPTAGGAILTLSDTDNGAYDFAFTLNSDGSITKDIIPVPEPGSIIVWSLVACGLVVPALRRRKKAIEA